MSDGLPINQITQVKFNEIEKELTEVQKDMIGVKHLLNSQGEILKEIKDVLVKQSETLDKVATLTENQRLMQLEINEMKADFSVRKQSTDVFIDEGRNFMSKWRGGLAVALFCFTMIQALIGYGITSLYNQVEYLNRENSSLQKDVAVLQEKVRTYDETSKNK